MLRRFTFTLKDQVVLPENKKANVEGSLWELDARTPGKKKKEIVALLLHAILTT